MCYLFKRDQDQVTRAKLIGFAGGWLVKLLCATLRFRTQDVAGALQLPRDRRYIGIFWHDCLFVIPWYFSRYMKPHRAAALTSASKDGDIMATILGQFGIGAIRGSSSRRGAVAMLEMKRALDAGFEVAITPDGPRGPKHQLHSGVIALAQHTGVSVLPIRVSYSRCWRLRSWDEFQIPYPFATVEVTLLPLVQVPPTPSAEEFERERERMERLLRGG